MERIRENYNEEVSEDVSLCDLPLFISLTKEEKEEEFNEPKIKKNQAPNDAVFEPQEEFNFGSVAGATLADGWEMCAADEVFFQGQILPLRPSISSDKVNPIQSNPTKNITRSESFDRGSSTGFQSISSSRSSSSRSTTHREASTTHVTITRVTSEPRRNQFHTHPSPKPHIRASSARSSASNTTTLTRLDRVSSGKSNHRSSVWDIFRLGLVRTPDIELQEFRSSLRSNSRAIGKVGNSNTNTTPINRNSNRSSSCGANNNDNNSNNKINFRVCVIGDPTSSENTTNINVGNEKEKIMKFLSGCKCSAEAVASNAIVAKSKGNNNNNKNVFSATKLSNWTKLEKAILLEEEQRLIKKKNNYNIDYYNSNKMMQSGRDNRDDHDDRDDDDGKQQKQYLKDQGRRKKLSHVSHHRTYEWLKEVSHANLAMHV